MAPAVLSLTSCRSPAKVERPAVTQETQVSSPPVRPGEVLTSTEMERLRQERRELIARPSALGEETDTVAELRDRMGRRSR
jgi:hypothetical protein